jgi:hypothetical protein
METCVVGQKVGKNKSEFILPKILSQVFLKEKPEGHELVECLRIGFCLFALMRRGDRSKNQTRNGFLS